MSENAFIDWIKQHAAPLPPGSPVAVGPGDDCALIDLHDGSDMSFAIDTTCEGTHFHLDAATPEQIGWKALCRNLSDIAAMGHAPVAATAGVCFAPGMSRALAEGICRGLWSAAERYGCPVIGGDVTSAPDAKLTVSVAILGRGPHGDAFLRSGAREGDVLVVTGALGGSIRGRHLRFEPRLAEAARLQKLRGVTAMIDISDGLSTDLKHLCSAGDVGAVVEADDVPISDDARALSEQTRTEPLQHALHDGEDFELLFTVSPEAWAAIPARWDLPTPLHPIGRIVATDKGVMLCRNGALTSLAPGGFEHRF
jgi:thiamine-monophosphate kinase